LLKTNPRIRPNTTVPYIYDGLPSTRSKIIEENSIVYFGVFLVNALFKIISLKIIYSKIVVLGKTPIINWRFNKWVG
jgi:hypothetical protein